MANHTRGRGDGWLEAPPPRLGDALGIGDVAVFWIHILPARITLAILASLVVICTFAAPLVRLKRLTVLIGTTVIACLAFIPSCLFVTSMVDSHRFGVFEYANHSSINDENVEPFIPQDAKVIVVRKRDLGFEARFRIDREALERWVDAEWKQRGRDSNITRDEMERHPLPTERFFAGLPWNIPSGSEFYGSPRSGRGAGWYIWYDDRKGIAYEHGNYW